MTPGSTDFHIQHKILEPNQALGLGRWSDSGSNEENACVFLTRCAPPLPMILHPCADFCEVAVVYFSTYETAMSLSNAAPVGKWAHVHNAFMRTYGQRASYCIVTGPTLQHVLHGTNKIASTQRALPEFVATYERNPDVCFST